MPKKRIGVIYGSKSGEYEVSIVSASNVMEAMDKDKYEIVKIFISKNLEWYIGGRPEEGGRAFSPWEIPSVCDFALPILHGPNGEDGTVQGLLELLNIPYGGCGLLGCAAVMDKIVAKEIFASAGIPQVPYISLSSYDLDDEERRAAKIKEISEGLELPYFVKPANMGSSVGITKVKTAEELLPALLEAERYDSRIVVEHGIDCREMETGCMGNDSIEVADVGEVLTGAEFYTYDDKYVDGVSHTQIPADISEKEREYIRSYAKKAYLAAGCFGFARCDFMIDKKDGQIYINEINAIPGFTNISMFPKLFMAAGYSYPQIIERIIELGYERYNVKNNR